MAPHISIIIPAYCEEGNIQELLKRITQILKGEYEIIVVDDGSTDETYSVAERFEDGRVRVLKHPYRMGKTAALRTGFISAKGEVIVIIDGDLQYNPEEIPLFLKVVENGYPVVTGWRDFSKYPWSRLIPSKLYNWLTSLLLGGDVHDHNSGFKAFKREVVEDLLKIEWKKGLHRYLVAITSVLGYRVAELPVSLNERKSGHSTFSSSRLFWGFILLLRLTLELRVFRHLASAKTQSSSTQKVCMVSPHPSAGGGVSIYTEKLIRFLRRYLKVYFLSNKLGGELATEHRGVYPCWSPGIRYPFQIFRELCSFKPDIIHIQHEFFLYGGMLSSILFPLLLFLARLCGSAVVTLHGVIPLSNMDKRFLDVNEIRGRGLPICLLKIGLAFLTKAIVKLSNAVIVHENFFAEILRKEYSCPRKKIHTIPIGIDEIENKLAKNIAKRKLGLENRIIIFFFGNVARYKGIETLIDGFQLLAEKHPDWVLIIAGGENRRLKTRASYKRYVSELRHNAGEQIRFMGFIHDLTTYFSAADLLVFPYIVTMSSSAAFALAISYQKTVIASNISPFKEVLPQEALFNKYDPKSLSKKVEEIFNDHFSRREISTYIKRMRDDNSLSKVSLKTYRLYQNLQYRDSLRYLPTLLGTIRYMFKKAKRIAKEKGLRYVIVYGLSLAPKYLSYLCYWKFKTPEKFHFSGKNLPYLIHHYNSTWMNERTVEIPIIKDYINEYKGMNILEVGNVLSHYFQVSHDVIDKYEVESDGIIIEDAVDFRTTKKYNLIVSISTLEHIGIDEKPREPLKALRTIENLKRLMVSKGGKIVVTFLLGSNPYLDKMLRNNSFTKILCLKQSRNKWIEIDWSYIHNERKPFPSTLIIGIIEN